MYRILLILTILFISTNCSSDVPINDISEPPPVTEADKKFAGVFRPLDGVWQGRFHIYEDTLGQRPGPAQPQQLDTLNFDQLPLRLIQTIQVRQEYTSKTPYFQQVKITDAYTKGDQEKVVRSRGVNKIQNGELWCVIVKPDETVIHSGKTEGQHTIIWQRSERNPLKIEYFREKVEAKTYTIVGWGYYGDDDPALTPRLWFRGVYHRVN